MVRVATIVAVGSVSLLTLAGTLVSPLAGLAVGLASAVAVSVFVSRAAENPLKILTTLESLVYGEPADLSAFDDELASRIVALAEKMRSSKREKIEIRKLVVPREVEEAVDILGDASDKVASLLPLVETTGMTVQGNILDIIERERSSVAELGDYIQTLTAGIEEMNTQAQALADYSLETANMAETGKRISDNVALNVASINEVNQDMERAVSILVEHSKRIGEIVGVIGGIADQTNLLALNAAIEAARSGEHGKGFAVVAENIRELADQSKKATDQITELIRDMQSSIDTVVSSIKQEFKVTEEIKDAVQELIAAFDDIARRANETAGMVKDLSDGIEGQAHSVQMLTDTLDGVYSLQEEISSVVMPVVESFSEMQSRLDEIRKGLKDLEQSITRSKELLENVTARR